MDTCLALIMRHLHACTLSVQVKVGNLSLSCPALSFAGSCAACGLLWAPITRRPESYFPFRSLYCSVHVHI